MGTAAEPLTADQWMLLGIIMAVAAWVRLRNLDYNTAFVDETTSPLILGMLRNGEDTVGRGGILPWYGAWYLFPFMTSTIEPLGGIQALRVFCGMLGLGSVVASFGFTRELFGSTAALTAAAFISVLAPPVHSGRVVFREAGAIFYFAAALWFFVRAWRTDRSADWLAAAVLAFAAFLCKHPISVFAPPLVMACLFAGRRSLTYFAAPLIGLHLLYVGFYWPVWWDTLQMYRDTRVAQAPNAALFQIYVSQRLDFWVLLLCALLYTWRQHGRPRAVVGALVVVAFAFGILNLIQRTDYIVYKQATYPILLLLPPAAALLASSFPSNGNQRYLRIAVIIALPIILAFAGRSWRWTYDDVGSRWPSSALLRTYLLGRATEQDRVLTDVQALKYYLDGVFPRGNIVDAYYFPYKGLLGTAAYAAAVRDGYFGYIAFSGDAAGGYLTVRKAIEPYLAPRYNLVVRARDSVTGAIQEVWRRRNPELVPKIEPSSNTFRITSPVSGASLQSEGAVAVQGSLGAVRGAVFVLLDVFTDRWYPQGDALSVDDISNTFSGQVFLGGTGPNRCHHIIRARAFDARHHQLAEAAVVDIARTDPNGSAPACTWP